MSDGMIINTPKNGSFRVESTSEAATAVLGSMLIDPDCVGQVLQQVSDRDFYDPRQLLVFQAIRAQYVERKPVDGVTVSGRLKSAGHDLADYMGEAMEATPTSANVMAYVEALRQSATLARLRDAGVRLFNASYMDEVREILDECNALRVERRDVRKSTFAQLYDEFPKRHDPDTAAPSLPWDIAALNDDLRCGMGLQIVLGAYPGVGKTAFALQQAARMGRDVPVGYYSFESNRQTLYDRHVARTALVDGTRIRDNALTREDYDEIAQLRPQLAEPAVTLVDAAGMTAEDVIADAMASHYWAVYVDYVQNVQGQTRGRRYLPSEYERVTEISRTFAAFAAETGTAVILLSQLSRPNRTKKGQTPEPTLDSLRSSGQLEQDADGVMLMWREDDDDPDSVRKLKIAKNRHGPAGGFIRLAFDGAHQSFRQIENRYKGTAWGGKKKAEPDPQESMFAELDNDKELPF